MLHSVMIASLVALFGSTDQCQSDYNSPSVGDLGSHWTPEFQEDTLFLAVKWTEGKIVGIEEEGGKIKKIKFEGKDHNDQEGTWEVDADLNDEEEDVIRRLRNSGATGISMEVHLDGQTTTYNGSWISYSS